MASSDNGLLLLHDLGFVFTSSPTLRRICSLPSVFFRLVDISITLLTLRGRQLSPSLALAPLASLPELSTSDHLGEKLGDNAKSAKGLGVGRMSGTANALSARAALSCFSSSCKPKKKLLIAVTYSSFSANTSSKPAPPPCKPPN
jgi:hypothetical protein